MTEEDRQDGTVRQLELLEARLVAATRGAEVVAIAERAASPKAAVPQIMQAFALSEEQAVVVLDSQFRATTAGAREQIEREIRMVQSLLE